MTPTDEAIRDLVKRIYECLHGDAPGEHVDADEAGELLDEAATALEQMLEAVEEAEKVIGPFGVWAEIIDGNPTTAPTGDPCPLRLDYARLAEPYDVTMGHLRAAAEWQRKHGRHER